MIKLIDRYIFLEILIPFLLTLTALMTVLLTEQMVQLTELFLNKGVSLAAVGKVFLYLLPTFLIIAVPMTVLIATIICFSRLIADHEITALMASGISLSRLAVPVYLFSIFAFILTFSLSVWAKPWIGLSMKSAAMDLLKQEFSLSLAPGVFNEPMENMMIYVDDIPTPNRLSGILIYDLRDSSQPTLILAQQGVIFSDPESYVIGLRLLNGSQHREIANPDRYQWITFGRYEFKLDLADAVGRASAETDPSHGIEAIRSKLDGAQPLDRRELRTLEEYYKTYAFPFSCLIFGMIGLPLGLTIRQGGRLGGFALGMGMALIYYLFMIIADALVTSLILPPLAAAWFPNLIMAALAVFLIAGSNLGLFSKWFRSGAR